MRKAKVVNKVIDIISVILTIFNTAVVTFDSVNCCIIHQWFRSRLESCEFYRSLLFPIRIFSSLTYAISDKIITLMKPGITLCSRIN